MPKPRVLLKIGGESFSGRQNTGFNEGVIAATVGEIESIADFCELAIVVGGGNIFRGSLHGARLGLPTVPADYIGMTATLLNAQILESFLKIRGRGVRLMSGLEIPQIAEPFIYKKSIHHLEEGRIVILAAGTGSPRFSTDTAMVLRAVQIGASLVLKGTNTNGIFDRDPALDEAAVFIPEISYLDFIAQELKIVDPPAVSLAMGNNLPIRVFNIFTPDNLLKIIHGESIGSVIR